MARTRKGFAVNGWINLNKPSGLGSTPAVSIVRKLLKARKAGHAGTLDPAATGVLPIALGEATKTIPWLQDGQKIYDVTISWGEATTTDDAEGETVRQSKHRPTTADIQHVLPEFVGDVLQRPPDYSAVHIGGKRAYALAREGQALEIAPRIVHIERIEIQPIEFSGDTSLTKESKVEESHLRVWTGKGVYIRSLARDLGERLGCLGHVRKLARAQCGNFLLSDAISLDALRAIAHKKELLDEDDVASAFRPVLLPVVSGLDDIPVRILASYQARQIASGLSIPLEAIAKLEAAKLPQNGASQEIKPLSAMQPTQACSQSYFQSHDLAIAETASDSFAGQCQNFSKDLWLHHCLVCCESAHQPVAIAAVEDGRLKPVRVFNLP